MRKLFLSFSDVIVFKSQIAKDICGKYYETDKLKVKIIPNGVDNEFNKIQRKVHISNLTAVTLASKAGAETGLKYLKACINKFNPNIEIFIIGENRLNVMLAEQNNIQIIDKLDTENFANFLADKDIFLSINSYDTFSISAAEAMAAGCITIVTKQTGISAYIQNGINGFILNYYDIDGLKNCIAKITNNQELRTNIINQARKIYDSLNWNSVYKIYESLYKQLL